MPNQKTIHLISNAHLDPVWTWEWPEAAAEAMSTFRTAVELCEKDDHYVFNHNEVVLYQWVQQFEPELFKRIQKLVKQKKWHVMGGWYLQPDCNMPSGESIVRQIMYGKTYFKKHFGVDVKDAINFDPFGHSRGLVQILAKTGYTSYLFGRPDQNDCPLPADEFVWIGYDKSEILATRFKGWYNSSLGKAAEKIETWLHELKDENYRMILWGVGNHGGGPSRKDLRDINRLIKKNQKFNIVHSTPEAYFNELSPNRAQLPRHAGDINPWGVGCYTSQIRLKQKHRKLENAIFMTEKMASHAWVSGLADYPKGQLDRATESLLLGQFHDILPGSSIQNVEEAALDMLGHGLHITSNLQTKLFFALTEGQKAASRGEIPVFIYNPHPYRIRQLVECEFQLADYNLDPDRFTQVKVFHKGRQIPSQLENEIGNVYHDWRKKMVFFADLEANSLMRYDCRPELKPIIHTKQHSSALNIRVKTKDLEVVINAQTGLMDRLLIRGKNYIGKNAFAPLVLQDNEDSWGCLVNQFRKPKGRFKLMTRKQGTWFSGLDTPSIPSVRLIESGPVRDVIEVVFAYNASFICQQYKIPKEGTEIEVETRVYWNEKNSLLKLSIPVQLSHSHYLGEVMYGNGQLPNDGREAVSQKWCAVVSRQDNAALTCINNGVYGSDFSKDGLRLTLLRSPAYACFSLEKAELPEGHWARQRHTGRFLPRIDQGERVFRFWLNGGRVSPRLRHVSRESQLKNESPFILPFNPPGQGRKPKPLIQLSDDTVQVTAVKKAEKGNQLIVRLFEPTGRARRTILMLPCLGKRRQVSLQGFEIKTFRINPKSGKISEVDLLEQ